MPESSRISSAIAASSGESRVSIRPETSRSSARFSARVERGGSEKRKSSTGSSASRLSSIPGPEQAVVLGQEGEAEAGRLALLDQVLGVALAHLLLGDDHPLDVVLAGHPRDLVDRAQPRQRRRAGPCRAGPRGSRPAAGAPRGGWRSAARPRRPAVGRARSRCRSRPRSGGARRSAARRAATKQASTAPMPTMIALFGRERPDRAQPSRPSSDDRAQGAGGDQRGQLVEGAVADAAVVVVVEPVQLQHQQPGRAEEHRPEELGRRRWSRSSAVATQSAATIATQSPAASRRRSSAPRRREPLGPVSPSRVAISVWRAGRRVAARLAASAVRWRLARGVLALISRSIPRAGIRPRGLSSRAFSRSAWAAAASPASCSTRERR